MVDEDREGRMMADQDGRVYPLGRALRTTYDADNHDTLGSDVTGLMIDLSKVPYERVSLDVPPLPPAPMLAARSWRARLGSLFGGRRAGV